MIRGIRTPVLTHSQTLNAQRSLMGCTTVSKRERLVGLVLVSRTGDADSAV